jgi:hypothetical protein
MSEGAIFAVGAVLFIATTWATIAFFLSKLNDVHRREMLASSEISGIESDTFTEVHVRAPDSGS